jgi:hypothetical protein
MMNLNLLQILQVPSQETMLCSQTRHPMGETEQSDVYSDLYAFYFTLVVLMADVRPPLVSLLEGKAELFRMPGAGGKGREMGPP